MSKRGETRKRIIEGARLTFNSQRYGQVTTASLARKLGLAEGNLWYHFKTKRDLLAAIQADFLADTEALLASGEPDEDPVESYCAFLKSWRDLFSRYLFVFRDRADYGSHSPELIDAFPGLYGLLEARIDHLFGSLAKAGLLHVTADEIPDLVFNTVLITRFYFEFQSERLPVADESSTAGANAAVLRHQTLIARRIDAGIIERSRKALEE
jgi:AcrR family transcriptional regulator